MTKIVWTLDGRVKTIYYISKTEFVNFVAKLILTTALAFVIAIVIEIYKVL